jgi:hypothetical protein
VTTARIEPPSSGRWKSTEDLKKANDERESTPMRLVRENRERRVKARQSLRDLGRRLDLDGAGAFDRAGSKLLTGILAMLLDELEAR